MVHHTGMSVMENMFALRVELYCRGICMYLWFIHTNVLITNANTEGNRAEKDSTLPLIRIHQQLQATKCQKNIFNLQITSVSRCCSTAKQQKLFDFQATLE